MARLSDMRGDPAHAGRRAPLVPPPVRSISGNVIQLNGNGDGKKKGEDYANNVQKLVNTIERLLPNFTDSAMTSALEAINNNRAECSVSSSLVTGEDVNTSAYGDLNRQIVEVTTTLSHLLHETNRRYFKDQVQDLEPQLRDLFTTLPNVAVDPRVGAVIERGDEGNPDAKIALDGALAALAQALRERLRSYLMALYTRNFSSKKPPGGPGGGPPPGSGSSAQPVGAM